MNKPIESICIGCQTLAKDIPFYQQEAEREGISVSDWVEVHDGCFNPINGHTYCWDCYWLLGCPLGVAP